MPTVQAFTGEGREAQRFGASVEGLPHRDAAHPRALLLTMLAIVLVFGAIVFVLWLGAHAVLEGSMTGGDLGQFILYASIVSGAIGALSEVMGEAQRAAGAAERLLELLALRSSIESPLHPKPLPARHAGGAALQLRRSAFPILRARTTAALSHLNLSIKPGETVAVVGPSGAGKTTLFQLLLRFYDPQGRILLDGVDIRDLDLHTLRGAIGIVPQDTVIFSADAMENIRYGRPRPATPK
jgi:ATP-binding cassette subfamily B protein